MERRVGPAFTPLRRVGLGGRRVATDDRAGHTWKEENELFSKVKAKFKENPTLYYAMSIAATWAGVGSLMNGITMVQDYGIVPFIIWAAGNTLACVVFGIFAPKIPKLRDVFRSRPMHIIIGFMCVFQIFLSMNGIQAVFEETILPAGFGMLRMPDK